MLTLQRNGFRPNLNAYGRIDEMNYSYTVDGKLDEIEETSAANLGFKTAATNGIAQYQYDLNGNMTDDDHKNIMVAYNYLNLPTRVEKPNEGEILWSYDATGRKLSKEVLQDSLKIDDNPIGDGKYYANWITSMGNIDSGSDVQFIARDSIVLKPGFSAKDNFIAKIGANEGTIRNYVSGIEYFEGEMEAIYHEVGRVFFENDSPIYEYVLSDHLGNTRTVFFEGDNGVEVVQRNDYYAFGLGFEEASDSYSYKFNGTEENSDLGLSWNYTFFRNYDYSMARWIQADPLAEQMTDFSPYHFSFNNPKLWTDPFGLIGENATTSEEIIEEAWNSTAENGAATYTVSFNPYAGDEVSREETNNGFNVYYEGAFTVQQSKTSQTNFKPFSKSELIKYSRATGQCVKCTSNELGAIFEDIFETYAKGQPILRTANFYRNKVRQPYSNRTTVPDFIADAVSWKYNGPIPVATPALGGTWYEVKAKYGDLYMSSNTGQIAGHIDNVYKKFANFRRDHPHFQPGLYLITTSDVRVSNKIFQYASGRVRVMHQIAYYRIVNGEYEFGF